MKELSFSHEQSLNNKQVGMKEKITNGSNNKYDPDKKLKLVYMSELHEAAMQKKY